AERAPRAELGLVARRPGVAPFEADGRRGRGALPGRGHEAVGDVDADDLVAGAGQGEGVAAGAAADVEDPGAGRQAETVDEERDLLLRALGEGVAEVGGTEVIGDILEPVAIVPVHRRQLRAPAGTGSLPSAV